MNPRCCFGSSCFPPAKSKGLELIFDMLLVSAEHASCTYAELGCTREQTPLYVQICFASPNAPISYF